MGKTIFTALMFIFLVAVPLAEAQQETATQDEPELSQITATPEEGFQVAITLARKAVTETQPDKDVLKKLRPAYAHDPNSLIAVSHVVAVHFQTVAAANNYWKDR
ncbi:MAG: hexameric tyrosine-coordinated heme protein [Desulfovibrionales bacterium]